MDSPTTLSTGQEFDSRASAALCKPLTDVTKQYNNLILAMWARCSAVRKL